MYLYMDNTCCTKHDKIVVSFLPCYGTASPIFAMESVSLMPRVFAMEQLNLKEIQSNLMYDVTMELGHLFQSIDLEI